MSDTKSSGKRLFDNKQLIHIGAEVFALLSVVFYFSSKNKTLLGHIEEMAQQIEEQQTQIENMSGMVQQMRDMLQQLPINNIMQGIGEQNNRLDLLENMMEKQKRKTKKYYENEDDMESEEESEDEMVLEQKNRRKNLRRKVQKNHQTRKSKKEHKSRKNDNVRFDLSQNNRKQEPEVYNTEPVNSVEQPSNNYIGQNVGQNVGPNNFHHATVEEISSDEDISGSDLDELIAEELGDLQQNE